MIRQKKASSFAMQRNKEKQVVFERWTECVNIANCRGWGRVAFIEAFEKVGREASTLVVAAVAVAVTVAAKVCDERGREGTDAGLWCWSAGRPGPAWSWP